LPQRRPTKRGDIGAFVEDSPLAWVDEAIDHAQKRGFSGPRAADDPGKAAAVDLERRVGHSRRGTEIFRNAFGNEHAQSAATANGLAGAFYSRMTSPAADAGPL